MLRYSPSFIETGVALDGSTQESLSVENTGLANVTNLGVALVRADGMPAPQRIYKFEVLAVVEMTFLIKVRERRRISEVIRRV